MYIVFIYNILQDIRTLKQLIEIIIDMTAYYEYQKLHKDLKRYMNSKSKIILSLVC